MRVAAGQHYRLLHPRDGRYTTFTVLEVKDGYALVQGSRVRKIRLTQFANKHYYQLLKDA